MHFKVVVSNTQGIEVYFGEPPESTTPHVTDESLASVQTYANVSKDVDVFTVQFRMTVVTLAFQQLRSQQTLQLAAESFTNAAQFSCMYLLDHFNDGGQCLLTAAYLQILSAWATAKDGLVVVSLTKKKYVPLIQMLWDMQRTLALFAKQSMHRVVSHKGERPTVQPIPPCSTPEQALHVLQRAANRLRNKYGLSRVTDFHGLVTRVQSGYAAVLVIGEQHTSMFDWGTGGGVPEYANMNPDGALFLIEAMQNVIGRQLLTELDHENGVTPSTGIMMLTAERLINGVSAGSLLKTLENVDIRDTQTPPEHWDRPVEAGFKNNVAVFMASLSDIVNPFQADGFLRFLRGSFKQNVWDTSYWSVALMDAWAFCRMQNAGAGLICYIAGTGHTQALMEWAAKDRDNTRILFSITQDAYSHIIDECRLLPADTFQLATRAASSCDTRLPVSYTSKYGVFNVQFSGNFVLIEHESGSIQFNGPTPTSRELLSALVLGMVSSAVAVVASRRPLDTAQPWTVVCAPSDGYLASKRVDRLTIKSDQFLGPRGVVTSFIDDSGRWCVKGRDEEVLSVRQGVFLAIEPWSVVGAIQACARVGSAFNTATSSEGRTVYHVHHKRTSGEVTLTAFINGLRKVIGTMNEERVRERFGTGPNGLGQLFWTTP